MLVAAGSGVGYFFAYPSQNTKTIAPYGTCVHPTLPSNPLSAVMITPPSSTGYVCVTYGLAFQQYQQLILSGGTVFGLGSNGTLLFTPAPGVSTTAVAVTENQDNETVVYQMETSGNSTGAYVWGMPGTCPALPLVVGYYATTSEASALEQYLSGKFSCPSYAFLFHFDGLSGISLISLTTP